LSEQKNITMAKRKHSGAPAKKIQEATCLCILVLCTVAYGISHLKNWQGPASSLTNDLFIPAVMMNAGHGFTNLDADDIPRLRDFLDFKQPSFSLDDIPEKPITITLHPYQEFHRYLIYSVAAVWYCCGVNWDAVVLLLVLLFLISTVLVYAISRQAANPVSSLLATLAFASSAAVVWSLPILRDFAKVPFILGLFLIMGWLIRDRLSYKRYYILSLTAGLIMGVGVGFRRDILVFVPLMLAMLAIVRFHTHSLSLPRRGIALLITLLSLFLAGLPVHLSLHREGSLAAHDTLMGFATYSDKELGLITPASYEKHYLLNDLYCTMKAYDAAKRGVTFPPGAYEEGWSDPHFDVKMKNAYLRKLIWTFPADVLSRAYASVVRINTAFPPRPDSLLRSIEKYGFYFLFITFMLLAGKNPRIAFLLLIVLCFSCGITSLQFGVRHTVHLAFLPYFFAAFVLEFLLRGLRWFFLDGEDRTTRKKLKSLCIGARRALLWMLMVALAFLLPWKGAQALQRRQLAPLVKHYEDARSRPLRYTTREWDGRILFIPLDYSPGEEPTGPHLIDHISSRLFEIRLANLPDNPDIQLVYEAEKEYWDFSAPLSCQLAPAAQASPQRYFFPVHESFFPGDTSHFIGISLPGNQHHCFMGFYEPKMEQLPELLMPMLLSSEEHSFLFWQQIQIPWTGTCSQRYTSKAEFQPFIAKTSIKDAIIKGNMQEALDQIEEALCHRPDSPEFTVLHLEVLEATGKMEKAEEEAVALLEAFQASEVASRQLNGFYERQGGTLRRDEAWKTISDRLSHAPWVERLFTFQPLSGNR
jgi:hypothetical protein